MRVALITTDSREHYRQYAETVPHFGAAPEALLQGFGRLSELEVHVVSCTREPMTSPRQLGKNIFFHSLHVPKLGWLRTGYQGCIRAVRGLLREIRPDLAHGQGTERDCALDAIYSGFPNVLTIHGNMREHAQVVRAPSFDYWWFTARLEAFALRRAGGVFCNSAHTERLVWPLARRAWRVPNAVREEFFAAPAAPPASRPSRCRLVNVGVIVPGKRQLELLAVARELRRQGLEFEFDFVGHAEPGHPYAAAFLEQIKPLEKEGFARYTDRIPAPELIKLLDSSSALVHFPPEESFGLVVAEALARNLRVFAARVGGLADIAEGVPGAELFNLDDWPALTSALTNWIRSGGLHPPGASAIMRSRYHPDVIVQRHLEIYREVLG